MRLTLINLLNKVRPHGKLYRGKNRKVKQIKPVEMFDLQKDFEREERNMLLLRHPYLTLDQSTGYMRELKAKREQDNPKLLPSFRSLKFTRQYSYEDALCHLKVKDAWD